MSDRSLDGTASLVQPTVAPQSYGTAGRRRSSIPWRSISARAFSVNEQGVVVGQSTPDGTGGNGARAVRWDGGSVRATLWQSGSTIDLGSAGDYSSATAINNKGT
jgi:hypothetical protein